MEDIYGYPPRTVGRDMALIGVVAGVLTGIHLGLAPATRAQLAFNHDSLDLLSAYTSAFVHLDDSHLIGNIAGYVAATLVAYSLCLKARQRRWFHVTFGSFLAVLPALVSLTSYVLLDVRYPAIDPITRGFSGVGAAFTGFVFLALLVVVQREYGWLISRYVGLAVWLWLLLELFVIYGGALLPVVLIITVAGWGFCGWGVLDEFRGTDLHSGLQDAAENIVIILLVVQLLTLFVYILFPAEPVDGGTVTNVFAHAAGFGYGLLGAGLTYRVVHR